jgi:hypothetical protein
MIGERMNDPKTEGGAFVYEARASEADLTEIGRHMAGH